MAHFKTACLLSGFLLLAWHASLADDATKAEYLADELLDRVVSSQIHLGTLGLNTAVNPPPHGKGSRLCINRKFYEHGLGMWAPGELVVDLGGQYDAFVAEVGIQWQGGKSPGTVVFQVFVDGRKEFDSAVITEKDPPKQVCVSIKAANQLRLVATDAGDGSRSDLADWANARLTRDPKVQRQPSPEPVNVATFGRVVTSDPKRMTGTKATRLQEFPAEDLVLTRELQASGDGNYQVPTDADGTGCIGLEWYEIRYLRDVGLRLADPATMSDGVRLQQWLGESGWQGIWQTVNASPEKGETRWIWHIPYQDRRKPTQKIRWLFPRTTKQIVVMGLTAHTTSFWGTASLRIEAAGKAVVTPIQIELYNGQFSGTDAGSSSTRRTWDPVKPLQVVLRFARTEAFKTDRTVLRFTTADQVFGVAVEDVLANGAVYVPAAGLFVSRDPPPVSLGEYLKKIAGQKTLRQRVEEMPDQDFQQELAKTHNPIQNMGPMMVSLACDNRKVVVDRNGTIHFDLYDAPDRDYGNPPFWSTPVALPPLSLAPQYGSGDVQVSRHLDGGWLPKPVTTVINNGVKYQQCTYVAPFDEKAPDNCPSWYRERAVCVAEYSIANPLPTEAGVSLELTFSRTQDKSKSTPPLEFRPSKDGLVALSDQRVLAVFDAGQSAPLKLAHQADGVVVTGKLAAGQNARLAVYLPAWPVKPEDAGILSGHGDWAAQTQRYWQDLMAGAAQIDVPDPLLNNVIRASQVHCLIAARTEDRGQRIAPWIAALAYGPLDSEAQTVIRGMDMMGQQDFARRALDYFVARYNKAGFLTTGYTIVGTGQHLWTLAEFVDRSHDRPWLKKVAPEVARLCHWIVRQTEKTTKIDANGLKAPNDGLAPPTVGADWGRFLNSPFQDSHYCAGLREGARVLAEIGHPDAKILAAKAEAYRQSILRAYRWTQARSPVIPLGNGTWVPAQPPIFFVFGETGGFFPGEDFGRVRYKGDGAHYAMACRVIDPNGADTAHMLDIMEEVEFLLPGYNEPAYSADANRRHWFELGGFNKAQPYYRRNVEIYVLRDEVKPFIRGYFNTIPSLLNLENLSFWEHFHNGGAWDKTHETGQFLFQTRIMLVQERGNQLWLAPCVTRNWLKQGMTINVQNSPTRFGTVSYRIHSDADNGAIEAVIDPPTVSPPSQIVLRLRHPCERPITMVTVNGKAYGEFDAKAETIRLAPGAERLTVRVSYSE